MAGTSVCCHTTLSAGQLSFLATEGNLSRRECKVVLQRGLRTNSPKSSWPSKSTYTEFLQDSRFNRDVSWARSPVCRASLRDNDVRGSVDDVSRSAALTVLEDERRSSNGRASYSGTAAESLEELESQKRQSLFNRIAPMYDQLNDWLSLGQHRIWKRMAVKWSRASRGDNVLDICCGSGDVAFQLAEAVGPEGQVTGLDFSSEQLGVAASRQEASYKASKQRMRWIEGDALSLPFDSNTFDAATMGYGLRNVTDIPRSLREIHRVVKTGATVAILDFNNASGTLIGELQGWLLDNVVVPVARQFQVEEQYEYLRPSIERFPRGRELVRLAKVAGFKKVVHYEIANGLMGVLVATK